MTEQVFVGRDAEMAILKADLEKVYHDRACQVRLIEGNAGSGKTTLMNILGCLDRPTSGKHWLDGQDISSMFKVVGILNRKGANLWDGTRTTFFWPH